MENFASIGIFLSAGKEAYLGDFTSEHFAYGIIRHPAYIALALLGWRYRSHLDDGWAMGKRWLNGVLGRLVKQPQRQGVGMFAFII